MGNKKKTQHKTASQQQTSLNISNFTHFNNMFAEDNLNFENPDCDAYFSFNNNESSQAQSTENYPQQNFSYFDVMLHYENTNQTELIHGFFSSINADGYINL